MKITIEHYESEYAIKTPHDEVDLTEVLCLIGGLLKSAGFSFNGEVGIVNPEEDPDTQREDTE